MGKFLKISVLFTLSFVSSVVYGQDDRRKAYEDFINQRSAEFENWREQANREFTSYLEKAWEEFLVHTGRKDPVGEVPQRPEYYKPGESDQNSQHGYPSDVEMGYPEAMLDIPIDATMSESGENVDIDFFGFPEMVPFSQSMRLDEVLAKEKSVSVAWDFLSKSQYLPTVEAINDIKERYGLNDWAVYSLVKKVSEAIYLEHDINKRIVTQMFILSQMKYKVRVGAAGDELVMLIPFTDDVFQVPFVNDDEFELYVFGYTPMLSSTTLTTFTQDFPGSDKLMSLVVNKQMHIGDGGYYKNVNLPLWSEILGENFVVPINKPYVGLTYDYPQCDLLTYHNSLVDTETSKYVLRKVKLKILKEGMNDVEAVAFMLGLVQNGFEYRTDYEMFGRTKPLFIEESFYYGANNCKDRVLIFSWLVKNITGLETVMLLYPNHVACGVAFNSNVEGDSFSLKGIDYTMCDPTYIGAPIGATMSKYRSVNPSIIELK